MGLKAVQTGKGKVSTRSPTTIMSPLYSQKGMKALGLFFICGGWVVKAWVSLLSLNGVLLLESIEIVWNSEWFEHLKGEEVPKFFKSFIFEGAAHRTVPDSMLILSF